MGEQRKRIDIIGQRFGRWLVLSVYDKVENNGQLRYLCRCDCGTEKPVLGASLRFGASVSCGCLKAEVTSARVLRHGHTVGHDSTPEYEAWQGMRRRCERPTRAEFKDYGGRGITVCPRWRDSFEAFLADVGPRPAPGYSIDRFPDMNGNYEPGNVRWATRQQQNENRRNTRWLVVNGIRASVAGWARMMGIRRTVITGRLGLGWSESAAVLTPIGGKRP